MTEPQITVVAEIDPDSTGADVEVFVDGHKVDYEEHVFDGYHLGGDGHEEHQRYLVGLLGYLVDEPANDLERSLDRFARFAIDSSPWFLSELEEAAKEIA